MRVVLAHESSATRRRLGELLCAAGHEVAEACGAADAFALCRELRPDVLLVSDVLCKRDGTAVVELVKGDVDVFRTAVVLIAHPEVSAQRAAAELRRGVQDLLVEPVGEGEAIARVQSAGRTKILQEELVEQSRRLEDQLFEDPLTGRYNRRFLFSQLGALVSGARRHQRPLAVAMVDLDDFKAINDRHGHETGDRVLVAAADALQRSLRAEDVLGRLGGEEFLALLPDTDADAAAVAAERLREAVASAGGPVPVTASVGWSVLRDGDAPDDLVRRADKALYGAKGAGRDRIAGAADPSATLRRRT